MLSRNRRHTFASLRRLSALTTLLSALQSQAVNGCEIQWWMKMAEKGIIIFDDCLERQHK
jgi:hypothetical protein